MVVIYQFKNNNMLNENLNIKRETMRAIWVPEEVHLALKKVALKEGQPIHNLVAILINNYKIYKDETQRK
jgi:hypothetical protein